MVYEYRYWRKDPEAPFAALPKVLDAHCHPEAGWEACDALVENAGDPELAESMAPFKEQLIAAIKEPGTVPERALFDAAMYSDGSAEKFLRRL